MGNRPYWKTIKYPILISLLIWTCSTVQADLSQTTGHSLEGFELNFGISGSWVDPDSPGQGLFFDVNPETHLFWLSWFTFGDVAPGATSIIGKPDNRWFVALGTYSEESNEVTLSIFETEGGVFDDPTAVTESTVGSIILTFASCSEATLEFSFTDNGLQAQISLQRLTSTEVCEAFLSAP